MRSTLSVPDCKCFPLPGALTEVGQATFQKVLEFDTFGYLSIGVHISNTHV